LKPHLPGDGTAQNRIGRAHRPHCPGIGTRGFATSAALKSGKSSQKGAKSQNTGVFRQFLHVV
jgi:hypothetical protein